MTTEPATSPTTPSGPRRGPHVDLDPSGQLTGREPDREARQFLSYGFYKLDPAFRRLGVGEREAARTEFAALLEEWAASDEVIVRSYSLVGLRADVDFMLWLISSDLDCFQHFQAALNATALGAYLTQPHRFLSLQKRSQYVNRIEGAGAGVQLVAGEGKYLFVYPFVKTRPWYALSPHARQGMMDEHINASRPFQGVRINTSYSYGIDDQDFVVSFDCDHPQEFVDLVGRLRYTEASLYTQKDTPMFTCRRTTISELLAQLG
ncbi:MAG: chlorite dismutase family protein [Chloroflexi bacterium]|nr:chlorite dismutase family protein [Chloroflexota bacterium]